MGARRHTLASVRRVERATGRLVAASVSRMSEELAWFRELPPEHRSWVGLVAQAGITAFVEWLRAPDGVDLTKPVFGVAPRELARAVSLRQAVHLVRLTVDVMEQHIDELAAPGETVALREAMLRFSREVAFAAAQVYAAAAEERGAWHARQRALFIEGVLRSETPESLRARASTLGWPAMDFVTVVAGVAPDGEPEAVLDDAERICHTAGLAALAGWHADRLVVIVGAADRPWQRLGTALAAWGKGPVVVGPVVADLADLSRSARAAQAGFRVVGAWPAAPRPVAADDLLPERALGGDIEARDQLVEEIYNNLAVTAPAILDTIAGYLSNGGSIEATARALYLHPNTVRYRLRKAAEISGVVVTEPRGAFIMQVAMALGRLSTP